MKNKKGFLLAEETLKIVIAVICIGFLVYLLTSLYLKNKDNEKLEQAEASLEHLISEINAEHTEVEIYNPKGWVLISWPYENELIPNSCSNMGWGNCICICDEDLSTRTVKGLIKDCDSLGSCLESFELKIENDRNIYKKNLRNSIVIKPPLKLNIDYKNNKITK